MSEKLLTFCQNNFNSSDKIWFYVSKRTFWIKKSCLGKRSVLETCSYFERKKINFFSEKNRRFSQNCFFNFRRNFSKKNTFPGKNVFFLSSSDIDWKIFGLLPEKLQGGCQNRNLRVCGTSVEKRIFLKEIRSFHHILISSWKVSTFCRVVFRRFFKVAFYIFTRTFRRKIVSAKFRSLINNFGSWPTKLQLPGEKNSQSCQHCLLRVHGTSFKEKSSLNV